MKKVSKSGSNRNLNVGDVVHVRDYRKSTETWTKGVVVKRFGPVTYLVQVDDVYWKRHIDQLRDISNTKTG